MQLIYTWFVKVKLREFALRNLFNLLSICLKHILLCRSTSFIIYHRLALPKPEDAPVMKICGHIEDSSSQNDVGINHILLVTTSKKLLKLSVLTDRMMVSRDKKSW